MTPLVRTQSFEIMMLLEVSIKCLPLVPSVKRQFNVFSFVEIVQEFVTTIVLIFLS